LKMTFKDYDVLSLVNLAVFLLVGEVPAARFWRNPTGDLDEPKQKLFAHGRSMKTELFRMASRHQMHDLETAVKSGSSLTPPLLRYFQFKSASPEKLPAADVLVRLADGKEMRMHSALMTQRSPFFDGLFWGRSGGRWVADRRVKGELIKVDLTHISKRTFELVARWIYAEDETLLDRLIATDTDDYLEQILEVHDAADELLIESLSHLCQLALCNQINVRNACYIITAVSQSPVPYLKDAGLEYVCRNLEAVLRHGHIEELDDDLLPELDAVSKNLQTSGQLPSRGEYMERVLKRNPQLLARMDQEKRAKIDSIVLLNKYSESLPKSHQHSASFKAGSFLEQLSLSPVNTKPKRRMSNQGSIGTPSPVSTPLMEGKASDMIFDMDDEDREFSLDLPVAEQTLSPGPSKETANLFADDTLLSGHEPVSPQS
jgi:inhibitor of Bruton tyrosine kinase